MQQYRFPPTGWLPLTVEPPDTSPHAYATKPRHCFKHEVPWLEYTLVGFSWVATAPIKLHDFKVGGSAILTLGEDPLPLRQHGWLIAPRFWPKCHAPNGPIVVIEADEAPEVSALIVPLADSTFGEGLNLVSEDGVKAFAQNMGTLQMWDAWPDCVEHDEQALQHHADLEREWKAWIEAAATSAGEYFAQLRRKKMAGVNWNL